MPFARGTILDGPPAWQARQAAQFEKMPLWLGIGGAIVARLPDAAVRRFARVTITRRPSVWSSGLR